MECYDAGYVRCYEPHSMRHAIEAVKGQRARLSIYFVDVLHVRIRKRSRGEANARDHQEALQEQSWRQCQSEQTTREQSTCHETLESITLLS